MVTIYVDGRPVQVPGRTSASDIRRAARSDPSRPIAKALSGRNIIISGAIDVSEGDRFIVGRPFTKGMQKFKVLTAKKQRRADKSIRAIFPQPLYEQLHEAFISSAAASREGYAVARCGIRTDGPGKSRDYYVRGLHIPGKEDLFEQSSITVTPKAEFIEAILGEAADKGDAILEIHTHVGSREPNFSWIDVENGIENGRFLRSCGLRFAMAVVGEDGFSFCEYDGDHDAIQTPWSARICIVGRNGLRDVLAHKSNSSCEIPSKARPETMSVAVAGLDGVGFGICSMLARHGVKDFVLLDSGVLEKNSVDVMPYTAEGGKRRTKAAQNMLKRISGDIDVTVVNDIPGNTRGVLKECDLIFLCGSDPELRAAAAEVSLKYFRPCIEAGALKEANGDGIYGRVSVVVPPVTGCSACFGGAATTAADGPSSVHVNGVVSSIAVDEFMHMLTDTARAFDQIDYDPATGAIERKLVNRDDACPCCGRDGMLGAGDDRRPRRP
jgi:molybdopterin/thiamine biosynthesis adenylyltransferase